MREHACTPGRHAMSLVRLTRALFVLGLGLVLQACAPAPPSPTAAPAKPAEAAKPAAPAQPAASPAAAPAPAAPAASPAAAQPTAAQAAAVPPPPGGQKVVLKISHNQQPTIPPAQALEMFKKTVEERTNGYYDVQIFPGQQLGSLRDQVE